MTPETLKAATELAKRIEKLEKQLSDLQRLQSQKDGTISILFQHYIAYNKAHWEADLPDTLVQELLSKAIDRLKYDIAQLKHTLASL